MPSKPSIQSLATQRSTREQDGRAVIDIDQYVPYFLEAVNNSLSRGASRLYLKRFGIGIVEWRIVSMLAIEPDIAAARICEVISLDKGAVSRGLESLDRLELLACRSLTSDPRRKIWRLSRKGYTLHDQIIAVALDREARLLHGVDTKDLEAFLRVMRVMRKNVNTLQQEGP